MTTPTTTSHAPGPTTAQMAVHAGIVQGIINRLAGQGSAVRRHCITLTVAAVGAAVAGLGEVIWPALAAVLVFAALDGYYLRQERLFRQLYDAIVDRRGVDYLDVDVRGYREVYWRALLSRTVLPVHLPLAFVLATVGAVAA